MPATRLFADSNYSGTSTDLEEGDHNLVDLNDKVSSLTVTPGYQVTVYTDKDCTGASRTFTGDTSYVGDALNDKISSVRVAKVLYFDGVDPLVNVDS